MTFYDISLTLSEKTFPWPGDTQFEAIENRGTGIVSKLIMSSHTGTHIDAPKHFIFDKAGIDKTSLSTLIGKFKVFELASKSLISVDELKILNIKSGDRILLKTKNSKIVDKPPFRTDYASLSLEAAEYLAKKKIALVGIDYLGIEAKGAPGHPVHKALLSKSIVNVEGLNLSKVKPGTYNGAILPLKIKNCDGSPCRAVLWK